MNTFDPDIEYSIGDITLNDAGVKQVLLQKIQDSPRDKIVQVWDLVDKGDSVFLVYETDFIVTVQEVLKEDDNVSNKFS